MPLRTNIADLKLHVFGQLTLDIEVVLRRILAAHVRLHLSEQRVWTEHCPVCRLVPRRIENAIHAAQLRQAEGIGVSETSALVTKRLIQQSIEGECAPTKGWFSAELLQHKLLNGVIEQSPTCADAGLT